MKPCISQATTLKNPFEADPAAYRAGRLDGRRALADQARTFLESHTPAEALALLESSGLKPVAAASQGGLLLSRGAERAAHWDHFRRRLTLLQELGVPTLIVTADFVRQPDDREYARAAASLGEAAELAASFGVRLALEFQKSSPICACLETAIALIAQSGADNAGVCFDVFHYYTGPSKFEDLAYLSPRNLAWVQVCDLSGTPRELAGDGDRILPGEGDFQLGPIIDHLGRIGYDGYVSLEVLNPHLWQVAADRVADLGHQALRRVLGRWESAPAEAAGRALSMSSVATLQPAAVVFREEQYFDWRVYALIALVGLAHRTRFGPRARLVARSRTGPLDRPGPLDVRDRLSAAHDHGSEPDRSPRLVRVGSDVSADRADRHGSQRRSRHLPPDRRLWVLGNSIGTRRRESVHRPRQSRRPARADRWHEAA